jgi:ornithine carrier protein
MDGPGEPAGEVTAPTASALSAATDVICGSIAGAAGKIVEYPFDTVKVRLQAQPDDRPLRYKGPIDCFRQSFKEGGLNSLYRGVSSPIIGAAAENASLFLVYNLSREWLKGLGLGGTSFSLVCGGVAGAVTSYVLTPIELVKCNMQVQALTGGRLGAWRILADVYRADGISGFWRGQTGTLIREAGGSAAWFGAYETVTGFIRRHTGRDPNVAEAMLAGACAGVSYNLSLFPADTIKSRMQTQAVLGSQQSGFFATGIAMFRAGGISALYRGCGITCMRSAPSSAIIFLTYEKLKDLSHSLSVTDDATPLTI